MQRAIRILGWIFVAGIVLLTVDYFRVEARDRRVAAAVARLGGRMGSLPLWPMGTEYHISFSHALTGDELGSLAELNSLRGHVGVKFSDCDLSEMQQEQIRRNLASCFVLWDNGDTVVRLNDP
jgi:hypothetical protein